MDDPPPYIKRLITYGMEDALSDTPVICLLGPRQCGKSTLAENLDPNRRYITLDDPSLLRLANKDPMGFVNDLPEKVTIDEVQRVPELLLAIKRSVDSNRKPGRFILTGSANLLQLPRLADSLAGRMECIYLQPLAEAEKEASSGQFLAQLLTDTISQDFAANAPSSPTDLPQRLCTGGYPEAHKRTHRRAGQWFSQYIRAIMERDVRDISQIRDPSNLGRILELLAFRNAELLNITSLGNDLASDRDTVTRHLAILEKLFLIRQLPAWHRNDSKRLIKTPKIHFVDSGLTAHLAKLRPEQWTSHRDRFGHLLESFVVQQLIAQAGWTEPDLRFYHYRDKDQVEVDCVLTLGRDVWGIEIKLAASVDPSDGKGLRRLAEQAGKDFRKGILFYYGPHTIRLADPRFMAVPLSKLWEI